MIPSLRQAVLLPPIRDPDARDYIRRVAAADGQPLEPLVQRAIEAFVRGCKSDGIWNAIKASCILAGARTLSGALVPLVGAAPTNNNFVAGDYNRETGLAGNGSTKYLDSNRAGNSDPQNSYHIAAAWSNPGTSVPAAISDRQPTGTTVDAAQTTFIGGVQATSRNSNGTIRAATSNSLSGISRSGINEWSVRAGGQTYLESSASTGVSSNTVKIFARGDVSFFSNGVCTFYSIGESLNLALLDARVTTLINAIGAAI